jgi:UDP-N-acetylmuramoyl-tripeptide--D-alanyl-D-alanine ligase
VTALGGAVVGACSAAALVAGIRWLRVAQREHYLPGAAWRFALRWWTQDPVSLAGAAVAVAGAALAFWWPAAGLVTAVVVAAGPPRLGLRGRTSPLAWTRRLRTLAAVTAGLAAVAVLAAVITAGVTGAGPVVAAAVALVVPLLVDLGCAITGPFERAAAHTHVRQARERLRRVGPAVVAITGSYGKTGTKGYAAHLLAGSKVVVASPASFNNRAGLARAVNENLAEGTEVFVAEMGTYGPGEIAELCSWLAPDIAVITAIGPVHLERFGNEERIVEAKAEILEGAETAVLNIDDPRLAVLADRFEERGGRVRRVSETEPGADVSVRAHPGGAGGLTLFVDGAEVAGVPDGTRPGNVACAVAVALEIGVPVEEIARRVGSLPTAAHRLETTVGAGGFVVLDDTYNANPAGARAALAELARSAPAPARRVVVTPGMVELGPVQAEENISFARAVAEVADDLVVVGRTNRAALLAGARTVGEGGRSDDGEGGRSDDRSGGPALRWMVVDRRDQAVAWVRDHLGTGDVVLYENDLPDHYP